MLINLIAVVGIIIFLGVMYYLSGVFSNAVVDTIVNLNIEFIVLPVLIDVSTVIPVVIIIKSTVN